MSQKRKRNLDDVFKPRTLYPWPTRNTTKEMTTWEISRCSWGLRLHSNTTNPAKGTVHCIAPTTFLQTSISTAGSSAFLPPDFTDKYIHMHIHIYTSITCVCVCERTHARVEETIWWKWHSWGLPGMERGCGCFALGGHSNLDLLCFNLLHHPENQLLFSIPILSSPCQGRVNTKIARTRNLISASNTIRGSQRKLPRVNILAHSSAR